MLWDWAQMVVVAVALWGHTPGEGRITVEEQYTYEPDHSTLAYALQPDGFGKPTHSPCIIRMVVPAIRDFGWATNREFMQTLIDHEVGHCKGMPHITQYGLMNPVFGWNFGAPDRYLFWSIYGRPRAILSIGGLSFD